MEELQLAPGTRVSNGDIPPDAAIVTWPQGGSEVIAADAWGGLAHSQETHSGHCRLGREQCVSGAGSAPSGDACFFLTGHLSAQDPKGKPRYWVFPPKRLRELPQPIAESLGAAHPIPPSWQGTELVAYCKVFPSAPRTVLWGTARG